MSSDGFADEIRWHRRILRLARREGWTTLAAMARVELRRYLRWRREDRDGGTQ